MIGLEAYQIYNAFNLHFNDNVDYDCMTYNFKTRVKPETFKRSPYRWQFASIEKKASADLRFVSFNSFCLCDYSYTKPLKFIRTVSKQLEITPSTILQSVVKKDLLYLKDRYNGSTNLFNSDGSLYPHLFQEFKDGKIDYRTMILVSVFIKDVINRETSKDIIAWPKYVKQADHVKGLFKYFYSKSEFETLFAETYLG